MAAFHNTSLPYGNRDSFDLRASYDLSGSTCNRSGYILRCGVVSICFLRVMRKNG